MLAKKRLLIFGVSGIALLALAVATFAAGFGFARAASSNNNHTISNNTPGFIKNAKDQGPVDPATVISVTVWLTLHNENQLDQLVQQQNQKGNANYHKWLTQAQFDAQFSPTAQEVKSVSNFLSAHNLAVLNVAENNWYVKVEGTVGAVEKAFHVQIDNYDLNGVSYYSNTGNPQVNDVSGAHVAAISGMDNYGFQPDLARPSNPDGTAVQPVALGSGSNGFFFESQCFTGVETHTFTGTGVSATYTGNRFGSDITNGNLGHLAPCGYQPSELQSAYNLNALYAAGLDGTGETVVITDAFGSPTIQQDAEVFSQLYGLPDLTPANFQVFQAPGSLNHPPTRHFGDPAGWADEITLDVEWVHAMAPGAHIALVVSPNNGSDLDEAINWAVVHHLGNTISNSWSSIEGFGNPARFNRDNRILEQAAAEGIDVNFSSGDFGDETVRVGFKSVDFPASSPFATAIGGTSLSLNANNSADFQTGWGTNLTRIANRTAEGSTPVDPPLNSAAAGLGFQFGAGGGASGVFAKPSWQAGLPGTTRQVPDVSLLADPFTGVEIIETIDGQLSVSVIGGTSLSCPMFSGIMAIAAQKAGHGIGQAAPLMYSLPAGAITDVTAVGSANNVSGSITDANGTTNYSADDLAQPLDGITTYYSAFYNSPFSTRWFVITFGTDTSLPTGSGWDTVTGVGTPNGFNFVNALS